VYVVPCVSLLIIHIAVIFYALILQNFPFLMRTRAGDLTYERCITVLLFPDVTKLANPCFHFSSSIDDLGRRHSQVFVL
jgi:hypothetical protein